MAAAVPWSRSSLTPGPDPRRLAVEATESACSRRSSVRVALPVTGWDSLLKFRIKPGEKLEKVHEGVSQSVEALVEKLRAHLEVSDLESNDRRYDVAKEECQARLAQWQNQLTEAKAATIRAESAKVEMTKLKESYLKEILQLRQQLSLKQLTESKGEEFVPDNVSHLPQEPEQTIIEGTDKTADEVKVLEMQYEKELDKLRRKNTELQYKLKTKQIQSDLQTDLLAKRMDLKAGRGSAVLRGAFEGKSAAHGAGEEAATNESRCARTPARKKSQGVGGSSPDVRSTSKPQRQAFRKPSLRYDCGTARDAGCGDEDDFVAASGNRISFSRQASADSAAPTREVSFVLPGATQGVSVAVQASFDPPVPADSPPMVRRPHRHLLSEKVTKEDEEEEVFRRPRPRMATAEGRLREKPSAPHNMRAVALPAEADDEVAPMMSISSGDHCAALFSTRPSEVARPAKRTITRPHLPNPSSSRPSSRCSCRERIDTQLMTTC
ncbi:hypothetical protein AK812_SmicGene21564 [Symbiodinium microadriaticum]|uniref:Uncharacterized protein n=1 Tax=Symbiodinium microadriaticum TaxID=2951 RepID=A0A1Q9DM34_SYMMI|nr:hypothetical protein AK812_SmicGene21564 [Symbiodinium microadriaticum]